MTAFFTTNKPIRGSCRERKAQVSYSLLELTAAAECTHKRGDLLKLKKFSTEKTALFASFPVIEFGNVRYYVNSFHTFITMI